MSFNKGDIIHYSFAIPDTGKLEYHPGVILSCKDVFDDDGCYVLAMMTSIVIEDKFSFILDNSMLDKPIDSESGYSQVRCHLITYALKKYIKDLRPNNKLKPEAFRLLIAYINEVVFEV